MQTFHIFVSCLLSALISALPSIWPPEPAGVVALPITKHATTSRNSLRPRSGVFSSPIHNINTGYSIDVTVGTPAQSLRLLLDTGSSDIFVFRSDCSGCSDKYFYPAKSTSFTTVSGLGDFGIEYGDHSTVNGFYGQDHFGVSNAIVNQVIGIATQAKGSGFSNGILGIGLDYDESSVRKVNKYYPGFITNLRDSGIIGARYYSIYLNSRTAGDTASGALILGGYDNSKWTGYLVPFPMVEKAPDGYYRLDVLEPAISYGIGAGVKAVSSGSNTVTVLLDTGTTLSYIPQDSFNVIAKAIGAQIVGSGPYYSVDCGLAQRPDGLYFDFKGPHGAVTISVPWAEMVLPEDAVPGRCALGLVPSTDVQVQGVYVLGATFLRSTYLTFDYDNLLIGIAQANYDHK